VAIGLAKFVRREVRSKSANTDSLAALYEIFAGNIEESIDASIDGAPDGLLPITTNQV
jgi:hypothetical protein